MGSYTRYPQTSFINIIIIATVTKAPTECSPCPGAKNTLLRAPQVLVTTVIWGSSTCSFSLAHEAPKALRD